MLFNNAERPFSIEKFEQFYALVFLFLSVL